MYSTMLRRSIFFASTRLSVAATSKAHVALRGMAGTAQSQTSAVRAILLLVFALNLSILNANDLIPPLSLSSTSWIILKK
jgi:hypothetical protein